MNIGKEQRTYIVEPMPEPMPEPKPAEKPQKPQPVEEEVPA